MQGLVAAIPTPVDSHGHPIENLFIEHAQWALKNGCDGLNVLGSTGEASSFDGQSRRRVMTWAAHGLDVARLMVGTGTPSLADTIALTRYADDLGYHVALVLPPYYYTPPADEGLINWYTELDKALGDRPIRVWFYNYPQMTGFAIPERVIKALHTRAPQRFDGIKDSSGDLAYCHRLVATMPDLRVFPSSETSLSIAASSGFAGCISATVNYSAPLCARLLHGRGEDDALVAQIAELRARISSQPLIPAIKHLVARRTGVADWSQTLPPLLPLDDAQAAALEHLVPDIAPATA
ncbi:MAG: dihydrodipicolinate synthase family protein [Ruegeria sp.]|nr:dihydrodipicolinate synthase family protein [Ruegeria sp.]